MQHFRKYYNIQFNQNLYDVKYFYVSDNAVKGEKTDLIQSKAIKCLKNKHKTEKSSLFFREKVLIFPIKCDRIQTHKK